MKSVVRSASRLALAAVVLAAAPVLAQDSPDQPAGPGAAPADPGATPAGGATPAKAERKVDPKAQAAFDAYEKLLACPPSARGATQCAARGEMELAQLPAGELIQLNPKWTKGARLEIDLVFPQSVVEQTTEEQREMGKAQLLGLMRPAVEPLFAGLTSVLGDYNLEWREEGESKSVVLTPFTKDAGSERMKVSFGSDGLVTKVVNTPKVDPDDPNAAMMAGADIEADVKHLKRGDRFVVTALDVTLPIGPAGITAEYVDGPDGMALPSVIQLSLPMLPEPMAVRFYDYVVDGKSVEGTAKPKPAAAAPPAPAEPEKGPEAGPGPGATPEPGADK